LTAASTTAAPNTLPISGETLSLTTALARIAGRAGAYDREPRFPARSFADLAAAGVVQLAGDRSRCGLLREIELVRAVAAADASTARVLDGHFNGVERLALCGSPALAERELGLVRRGQLLMGVWGADPVPPDGEPARIATDADGSSRLEGVKTFCSGAGGVQRAVVVARDPAGAKRLVYVDPRIDAEIDRSWYRGSGLRASESHRVVFRGTPVLALLGGPDELTREPWFSRDAVRTAATWAGLADCILAATIAALAGSAPDEVRLLGVGRMQVLRATIDRALSHAATELSPPFGDAPGNRPERRPQLASECRVGVASAARGLSANAAQVCGSRALVGEGSLDRARRDLDLFLLQHRLEPRLVELGARALQAGENHGVVDGELSRFERLYANEPDPWDYEASPYELAKRAATVAALPQRPLGRVLDLGCSNGMLTALIAERCEQVVAVDLSPRAVELAGERGLPENVRVMRARFPDELPPGEWDLVVCSEILYYLTPAQLWRAVRWLQARLESGATVLAVSWRGHGDEPMRGEDVHDLLEQELGAWHTLDGRQPGYRLDRFDGR
jgi:alkylation response protein AidB-like acyl-CoA dehydrogenase